MVPPDAHLGSAPSPGNQFLGQRILVVDDDRIISTILMEFVNTLGAQCIFTTNSQEAADWIQSREFDTILTDIYMPTLTGHDLLSLALDHLPHTPVILMTGHPTLENTIDALRLGAYDYLVKPFNLDVVQLTLERALQFRRITLENKRYQENLEQQVQERTQELQEFLFHSVQSLNYALEARDPYTQGHGRRVSHLLLLLAREFGIDDEHFESLRLAGLLHDIGKIGIPDQILLKQGPLSVDEYDIMKDHVYIGYKILSPIPSLNEVSRYVYEHHERMDGKGYPLGKTGEDIHFHSRLLVVTEVWDALATERIYKPAWPMGEIIEYFQDNAGSVFDPDVCHALISILKNRENTINDLLMM